MGLYSTVASRLKWALCHVGFEIRRVSPLTDSMEAVKALIANRTNPLVLDVGANVGQTIAKVRRALPGSRIHAFEPNTTILDELKAQTSNLPNLIVKDVALGAACGTAEFHVNSVSELSSCFLQGERRWGTVTRTIRVQIDTVDNYCAQNAIDKIDFLKIDAQGSELDVIRGSVGMIEENRVQLILTEINFEEMYVGAPRFDAILGFLADRGFQMVGIFNLHNVNNVLPWMDALFVDDKFIPGRPDISSASQ